MVNSEKQPEKKGKPQYSPKLLQNYFQMIWRVSAITVSTMAILGGVGYLLDKAIGKFPLFMAIGLMIAFPLSQFIVYRVFTKFSKKISQSSKK